MSPDRGRGTSGAGRGPEIARGVLPSCVNVFGGTATPRRAALCARRPSPGGGKPSAGGRGTTVYNVNAVPKGTALLARPTARPPALADLPADGVSGGFHGTAGGGVNLDTSRRCSPEHLDGEHKPQVLAEAPGAPGRGAPARNRDRPRFSFPSPALPVPPPKLGMPNSFPCAPLPWTWSTCGRIPYSMPKIPFDPSG